MGDEFQILVREGEEPRGAEAGLSCARWGSGFFIPLPIRKFTVDRDAFLKGADGREGTWTSMARTRPLASQAVVIADLCQVFSRGQDSSDPKRRELGM